MCCDQFDHGSRQVKHEPVDLVTEDYDILQYDFVGGFEIPIELCTEFLGFKHIFLKMDLNKFALHVLALLHKFHGSIMQKGTNFTTVSGPYLGVIKQSQIKF